MNPGDDAIAEGLRALANADRRRLLQLCLTRPLSAGELATHFSLAPASVSEHLKVLRKARLVVVEKRGRHWIYRADRRAIGRLLDNVAAFFDARN